MAKLPSISTDDHGSILTKGADDAMSAMALRISGQEIKKPTVTTYYSRSFSPLAGRLLTLLIHVAQVTSADPKGYYYINTRTIRKVLNIQRNDYSEIYQELDNLVDTSIKWNIHNEDRTSNPNITASILAAVIHDPKSKTGEIGFMFTQLFEPIIKRPTIYGRQKIMMLPLLNQPVHAYTLYEILVDALSRKQPEIDKTLEELHELLNTKSSVYAIRFTDFRRFVLKPSIERINEVSNINVEFEPRRIGRKIGLVKFHVTHKKNWQEFLPFPLNGATVEAFSSMLDAGLIENQSPRSLIDQKAGYALSEEAGKIFDKILKIGVTQKILEECLQTYGENGMKEIYDYFEHQKMRKNLDNPIAYISTLLREGHGVKTKAQRQAQVQNKLCSELQKKIKLLDKELETLTKNAQKKHKAASNKYINSLSDEDKDAIKQEFEERFNDGLLDELTAQNFSNGGWNNPLSEMILTTYITNNAVKGIETFIKVEEKAANVTRKGLREEITGLKAQLKELSENQL